MIEPSDLVTIGLLIALEGLLSADNAMVLAVLVLGLPKHQQAQALRYGIIGAFAFRSLATLLAAVSDRAGLGEAGGGRLPAVPVVPPFLPCRRRRVASHAAEGHGRGSG